MATKTAVKKTSAKKTPAKKTTAKKASAKKVTAKKTTAKKAVAKKATAKKATAKKSARSAKTTGRTLIAPNGDKRYVRRTAEGTFSESDEVGASLRQDVRKKAATKVAPGQGDRGDQQK